MKKFLCFLTVIILLSCTRLSFANHIEQPNFPRLPNPEIELMLKIDDFNCGDLYVFLYSVGYEKYWKFYYLGNNFSHKPIVVVFSDETVGFIKAWVDRDRDGHFDELFSDGADVAIKYPTPCILIGVNA